MTSQDTNTFTQPGERTGTLEDPQDRFNFNTGDTNLDRLYSELAAFLTDNNIPIEHSSENFDALINTFFGRDEVGVWAWDRMTRHFETYRLPDGTIDPQAAVDINAYLTNVGVPEHANFDATSSTDSGPITAPTETTASPDDTVIDQPVSIDNVIIPAGGRLIKVVGDNPGDPAEWYIRYDVFGAPFTFRIGSDQEFEELFPSGVGSFGGFDSIERRQFVNSDAFQFISGSIDEIIGSSESLQVQLQRDLDSLGLESVPSWMRDDPQAMVLLVQANREGWSSGRLGEALKDTQGFQSRFRWFDTIFQPDREDIFTAVSRGLQMEAQLSSLFREARGPNTDTSLGYLASVINTGWQVTQVAALLEGERQLMTDPDALQNLNEIRASQGLDQFSAGDFVLFLAGGASSQVFEDINDSLRQAALADQGVFITTEQARALGTGSSLGIAAEGAFSQQARRTALGIAENSRELDLGLLGISREAIIAAAFDDPDLLPSGTTLADVDLQLQQLGRQREVAAQGLPGVTSFIGNRGELRQLGLGSL